MRLLKFGLLLSALVHSSLLIAGPSINQFEVKDLDSEAGNIEFQTQNAHSFSHPDRQYQTNDMGETIYDDNSIAQQRHALELEYSVTDRLRIRIGIEYEKERLKEPETVIEANDFDSLQLDELAIEAVYVFIPATEEQIGFGILSELQYAIEKEDPHSFVFGPIIESHSGNWSTVTNFTLIHSFGGESEERDNKWDLAYASQVMYHFSSQWQLALEAYGTVERIGNTGTRSEENKIFGDHNQHRLGSVNYYAFDLGGDDIEAVFGTGLFFGLNNDTPDFTFKWSVEIEF